MRLDVLLSVFLLGSMTTTTLAHATAERIPEAKTANSVLMRRLTNAYKATQYQGQRLATLTAARRTNDGSGAGYINRTYLAGQRGVTLLPTTEEVITHAGWRGQKEVPKHVSTSSTRIEELLAGQHAAIQPKYDAHAMRTAKLEAHLLDTMDAQFIGKRAAWHASLASASTTTEKLAETAVSLIQQLDPHLSDRAGRKVKTGKGESHSSLSGSSTTFNLLGGTKSHAEISGSSDSQFEMNTLVLGASTYRIDVVERKHLAASHALTAEQKHTPEARVLVERIIQTSEIVQELQRRDARNGTHAAAPFTRWLQESTVEIAPAVAQGIRTARADVQIHAQDTRPGAGVQLRLSRIDKDLVDRASHLDLVTPAFASQLRRELAEKRTAFIDEAPSFE